MFVKHNIITTFWGYLYILKEFPRELCRYSRTITGFFAGIDTIVIVHCDEITVDLLSHY